MIVDGFRHQNFGIWTIFAWVMEDLAQKRPNLTFLLHLEGFYHYFNKYCHNSANNCPNSIILVPKLIYYHSPILWKHSFSQNDHKQRANRGRNQQNLQNWAFILLLKTLKSGITPNEGPKPISSQLFSESIFQYASFGVWHLPGSKKIYFPVSWQVWSC